MQQQPINSGNNPGFLSSLIQKIWPQGTAAKKSEPVFKYIRKYIGPKKQVNAGVGMPRYAGFGMRMLASLIDSTLSVIILLPLFGIFHQIYGFDETQRLLATGMLEPENMSREQVVDFVTRQAISFTFQNVLIAIAVIFFWIYKSATPGKMLLKMEIVDVKTGGHPSRRQLIIRYLGYFLAVLPLGLGFVWIHYDKKKQGWHDKLAGTMVVYKQ